LFGVGSYRPKNPKNQQKKPTPTKTNQNKKKTPGKSHGTREAQTKAGGFSWGNVFPNVKRTKGKRNVQREAQRGVETNLSVGGKITLVWGRVIR